MDLKWIVTPIAGLILACAGLQAQPQSRADEIVLDMAQAFQKGDKKRLAAGLAQTREHPLHAQVAYWELRNRLETASAAEVREFLQRFSGQYHEDRLRNDWLLQLGRARDWPHFEQEYALYRMHDDREVRCYALHLQARQEAGAPLPLIAREAVSLWLAQREADDGCDLAVSGLFQTGQVDSGQVWRKARQAMEAGRIRPARLAVQMVAPGLEGRLDEIHKNPLKYLKKYGVKRSDAQAGLNTLAIIRLASSDWEAAAEYITRSALHAEERNWLWAVIGKVAHLRNSSMALDYMRQVRNEGLNDDLLAWKTRIMLRAQQWREVLSGIEAMSDAARSDPAWIYWKGRALQASRNPDEQAQARLLFESIASMRGFYEQLAQEELGQALVLPAEPAPLNTAEMAQARDHAGLQRALHAIRIGLRSEGVREWNYSTNLHQRGGMHDRELLAAAHIACEAQVWDRCINSSDRTRQAFDARQRFPMPMQDLVVSRSREIGLDPAYVYGLIRQESRFIMDARSHVGASGLMQVMPATARWTAKKIGLAHYSRDMIADRDVNVQIGTGYLKLVLDDFQGSMPMAAAAYNAGPSRPRAWRNGPVLEGAIWAEGIPFSETRDYVKKVLSNTVTYAAILSGQPQSLKKRLGTVGPRDSSAPQENRDLP